MRVSSEFTHAGNLFPLILSSFFLAGDLPIPYPQLPKYFPTCFLPKWTEGGGLPRSGGPPPLEPLTLVFGLCPWRPPCPLSPSRYCTEGKRTFSSRLILEKHVQVRHGLPLGDQSPGRGSIVVRGPGARGQVGRGPVLGLWEWELAELQTLNFQRLGWGCQGH